LKDNIDLMENEKKRLEGENTFLLNENGYLKIGINKHEEKVNIEIFH
jgi:hypothetical protein